MRYENQSFVRKVQGGPLGALGGLAHIIYIYIISIFIYFYWHKTQDYIIYIYIYICAPHISVCFCSFLS